MDESRFVLNDHTPPGTSLSEESKPRPPIWSVISDVSAQVKQVRPS